MAPPDRLGKTHRHHDIEDANLALNIAERVSSRSLLMLEF